MNKNSIYLSIVIPVYNEEDNVGILYREIRSALDPLNIFYEIIFIDDGSIDGTFRKLKSIKKNEERGKEGFGKTRIIKFSRNFGQTAAMKAGFDHSLGEIIVSLDGDLQNDPADIPGFIDKLNEGYDVVCGWRKDRKDNTLSRIIPSKVANWIIYKISGLLVHDNGCSLKAYRMKVIKSLRLYSDMHRFIPAMATMVGARVAEIIVNHRARKYGKTKYGISRTWKVLFDMITIEMLLHFHFRPMLWFFRSSLIFFLCGFLFGFGSFFNFIKGESIIVLGASSILFFTLTGGLLSWGLLAEFLLKIENNSIFTDVNVSKSKSID